MQQPAASAKPQLLHLVFGGELTSLDGHEFRDLAGVDIVGVFPDYASAYAAWKDAAQRSVDNAMMRYFIVHLHRLLDPTGAARQATPAS
jgi:hypothetical protein